MKFDTRVITLTFGPHEVNSIDYYISINFEKFKLINEEIQTFVLLYIWDEEYNERNNMIMYLYLQDYFQIITNYQQLNKFSEEARHFIQIDKIYKFMRNLFDVSIDDMVKKVGEELF